MMIYVLTLRPLFHQAEPTKLELLSKEYQSKKDVYKDAEKDSILDKYGGKVYLEAPPKALLLAQTEEYVVYNRWKT